MLVFSFKKEGSREDSLFHSLHFHSLHAARYAERGGDGRQDADGYLNHHFPGFFFTIDRHRLLT